jgi:hypothetical protein
MGVLVLLGDLYEREKRGILYGGRLRPPFLLWRVIACKRAWAVRVCGGGQARNGTCVWTVVYLHCTGGLFNGRYDWMYIQYTTVWVQGQGGVCVDLHRCANFRSSHPPALDM